MNICAALNTTIRKKGLRRLISDVARVRRQKSQIGVKRNSVTCLFDCNAVAPVSYTHLLDAAYFSNEIHKKLAKLCYDAWSGASAPEAAQILLAFDEAQAGYVTQVLMDRAVYSDEVQAAKDLLLTIQQENITKKISEETDPAVIQKLLKLQAGLKDKRGGSPA